MRSHPDEYAPFVVDGDAEGSEGDDRCAPPLLCALPRHRIG